jgi:hypothetical protein
VRSLRRTMSDIGGFSLCGFRMLSL